MPRRHRRRPSDDSDSRLENMQASWRRSESRRGLEWTVQPISAARAVKSYRCPGCQTMIAPGVAHLAVWRADGVLGDRYDLESRRHWHDHCWRIA
ncbi:MAG: hypothetical protein ACTJHU_09730 [Mycetocola sp.]